MEPSIRVLMVTARFLPRIGGTELHTYELARRLVARGVDITVLTTDVDAGVLQSESEFGFRVVRVKAWPRRRDWYLAPGITSVIGSGEWDIVHVQGIHTLVLPMTLAALSRTDVPYIITLHSGGSSSIIRQRSRPVFWRLIARWIRAAERIIAVSEFERETFSGLLRLPQSKVVVIPSGADLPRSSERENTDGLQREDTAGPLIVSVGRLERYKGHDRILRALPAIADAFPNVRLLIVGSGPYERRLQQIARDLRVTSRVEIRAIPVGSREELNAVLDKAALVVALSAYESQGLAAMEAAARDRSVLVADSSALHELIERGLARGVGLDATENLAAAVIQQLRNPHRPAGKIPTWEECAADVHALYAAITE